MEGSVEGYVEVSVEGSVEGSVKGSVEGTVEVSVEGTVEGSVGVEIDQGQYESWVEQKVRTEGVLFILVGHFHCMDLA